MIPPFDSSGRLPPGDHDATLVELANSHLVHGVPSSPWSVGWDEKWRARLVANLAILVGHLQAAGISEIFIDGSYVEAVPHPNDIDGWFVCDAQRVLDGRLESELNAMDPNRSWAWRPEQRTARAPHPVKKLPMWHAYRVELYPDYGQPTGIVDERNRDLPFREAFRRSRRDGAVRGVVKIVEEPIGATR